MPPYRHKYWSATHAHKTHSMLENANCLANAAAACKEAWETVELLECSRAPEFILTHTLPYLIPLQLSWQRRRFSSDNSWTQVAEEGTGGGREPAILPSLAYRSHSLAHSLTHTGFFFSSSIQMSKATACSHTWMSSVFLRRGIDFALCLPCLVFANDSGERTPEQCYSVCQVSYVVIGMDDI